MNEAILNWLLEDENQEVKLRTLKEALHLPDNDEKVIECKRLLLQSKTYERALKKLREESGNDCRRSLVGSKAVCIGGAGDAGLQQGIVPLNGSKDIDEEVFGLI